VADQDITPVVLPSLGESVTEATVVEWLKQPGDAVALDEEIVEVTSDKADLRIPSPSAGVIARIVAQPGQTLEIGQLLCELSPNGAVATTNGSPPMTDTATPAESAATAPAVPEPPDEAPSIPDVGDAPIVAVTLPSLGESVTEATIVEWLKAPGDPVGLDEEIVEITSDKADLRVPSPAAGVLTEIVANPGDTIEVGQLLARLAAGATAAATSTAAPVAESAATSVMVGAPDAATGGGLASPLARRTAGELGVDLDAVTGSGPHGRIEAADVTAASNGSAAAAGAAEEAVRLVGPPAALAKYMDESRSVPTATTLRTIPVGILDIRRKQINEALARQNKKLSFTHLVAWALVKAVEKTPVMTTGFKEVDGKPHKVVRGHVNIGLAVDVERRDGSRSLLVPVVRGAETLGFAGFVDAYDDLVTRTRSGNVQPDELKGAYVTLTNTGGFGTTASVPRLMAGQGAIIATGSIALPVGFENTDAKALGIQKVMTTTSTYDHRVIQGADSGGFLRDMDLLLQGDGGFYDEVAQSLGITLPALPEPTVVAPPAAVAPVAAVPPITADMETLEAVAAATSLVKAHRLYGHLAASLDPLGYPPVGDPALEPATVGITPAQMEKVPADLLRVFIPGQNFAEVYPRMRDTYCGTIAYQVEHISSHEQRRWLRKEIESGFIRVPLPQEERVKLLERLVQVDLFERFLQRAYIGQKTFSIEGVDALVPMLDETIELCAESGANQIVIGMAHRGRLNVITQVVGRPVESILGEFEGMTESADDEDWIQTAGDVKYHLGAEGTYVTIGGRPVAITLAANPSHLEQVNAVVEGGTRARQTIRKGREAHHDSSLAVPVLVHGDAAFPGQGVVAETLNLNGLAGFSTGGTIHIIANNQIGFTTDPQDSRSTRYASDLAKGFDIPIIHVNADDVEACIAAIRLCVAYRNKFKRDILIDLVGYRRHGHNETDEPAYTQPVMSRIIKDHPRPYQVYATQLVAEGAVTEAQVAAMEEATNTRLQEARTAVMALAKEHAESGTPHQSPGKGTPNEVATAVPGDVLRGLNEELITVPDGFAVHPKLLPQLERRRDAMDEDGDILWGHAEALALSSLLIDGVPVRLTGQDSERGTFSQRHLRLHDADEEKWMPFTGSTYTPMCHLQNATATFEVFNSPLSEAATIGFEYGYSTLAPETLVIWEAQYGDFANGGQIMVDQFISSGRAKWGERSRLVMLLPHGYEGNGPEHSSARIERFLQACAEDNMRVANPSTAGNYFHLLRRQGLLSELRPLIVFTPKSLLRSPAAACRVGELTDGHFRPFIDDPTVEGRREKVTRLLLCSGKIYHDLDAAEARAGAADIAIARVEMLYPFPEQELVDAMAAYPNLTEVSWVQEEPRNMGAWTFVPRRLERILPDDVTLYYVGRSARSSPAEGYPQTHKVEQARIVAEAFAPGKDRVVP
jgi:2-oxoglutarate dehydrogenase E1 component